jgi:signal transduction histidine kinase
LLSLREELALFADHLQSRRPEILRAWELAVSADPELFVAAALSRVEFLDHVPALLDTFEGELREFHLVGESLKIRDFHRSAAGHGIKRWQQSYGLPQLVRELGRLNECLVNEINGYTRIERLVSHESISAVRQIWAHFTTVGIEESVRQYALLQREEANGQVHALEAALTELRGLEGQRADLWQQAAHDLRGNLGVVANASVGLTHSGLAEPARDKFVRILIRNVTSLHQLLDDVTQLARLQAGRETRRLESVDVTPLVHELCEGIRPVADQKQLYLHCSGPAGLGVEADAVKLRRIAQNLILNAVKFTQIGGITVTWGESDFEDSKHWVLTIADTGPGFPSESGRTIATALESERLAPVKVEAQAGSSSQNARSIHRGPPHPKVIDDGAGEGLGLSIVKRLCEMLDATLERHSKPNQGTTFRVLFPKSYST